eukprot:m.115825 g.115825  ORF g.115825 m.115825 type:complete len:568 (-) comp9295_c0_seq12:2801-4504(-)
MDQDGEDTIVELIREQDETLQKKDALKYEVVYDNTHSDEDHEAPNDETLTTAEEADGEKVEEKQVKSKKKGKKKKKKNNVKGGEDDVELFEPLIADEQPLNMTSSNDSLDAKFDTRTSISSSDYNTSNSDPIVESGYQTQTHHVEENTSGVRSSTVCGYLWIVTVVLVVCGFVPWGAIELHKHGAETHVIAWFVSGIFTSLAIPMTFWDVAMHLRNWNNPRLQRHIIRILFMVPIYAIDSWCALRFPDINIYFDVARETYEAYVIYNFYIYLLQFLRQRPDFDIVIHSRPNQPHKFPFCFLKEWRMGQPFINACTNGVTSYVVIRILTTIIALCTELVGKYGDSDVAFDKSWIYIVFLNSLSQIWAMYCLILFYYGFKQDLESIKPFQKFLTIKAIIFLSFWQNVVIAFLVEAGAIKTKSSWSYYTSESVAAGIQDFLICIEMFIAALVHHSVFSYKEHMPDNPSLARSQNLSFGGALRQLLDVRDVAYTVLDHVQTVYTIDGLLMEKRNVDRNGEHTALLTNNYSNKHGTQLSPDVPHPLQEDTQAPTTVSSQTTSYGSMNPKSDV